MEKQRSSKKQQELLQFIDNFIKGNGYGPSYREIMRGLGYKSVSTVAVHVDGLLAKGYIRKTDHSARSIEVVTMGHSTPVPHNTPAREDGGMAWLETAIAERLKKQLYDEATMLIAAAEVLGSERIAEFRSHFPSK